MGNLIIDIGNTRIKSGLFEGTELVWEASYDLLDEALIQWASISWNKCFISSVRWNLQELRGFLPFDFTLLTSHTALPILNNYGTPATLGLDRIAAAVGGWTLAGYGPVLVIDMGSCITYDLVDDSDRYLGGAISPGFFMRAKAMHSQTARLPLVDLSSKPAGLLGNNTISCMQIGIWYGIEFEIIGQIQAYSEEFPKIKVFVCGGDAQSFDSLAKDHIFVVPNLVLHGLNRILNHNVE